MSSIPFLHTALFLGLFVGTVPAARASDDVSLKTFDVALSRIRGSYYAAAASKDRLDELRDRFRPLAARSTSESQTTDVLRALLTELGDSHCSILSESVYQSTMQELAGRRSSTFGVLLEEARPGEVFVRALYEGGPVQAAGVRLGDRLLAVDGVDPLDSFHVVDAGYDPGENSLALFFLDPAEGELELTVQSDAEGRTRREIAVGPREYSGLDAGRASLRIFSVGGRRVGTVHAWYCAKGVDEMVRAALVGPLRQCDAVVIDLRGRGGLSNVADELGDLFEERVNRVGRRQPPTWDKPAVFLIDRHTRSAKEMLAYRLQQAGVGPLVGENTEGAVLAAGFFPLPNRTVLELAVANIEVDGVRLEGRGVAPDVVEPFEYLYASGRDVILERGVAVALRELRESPRAR